MLVCPLASVTSSWQRAPVGTFVTCVSSTVPQPLAAYRTVAATWVAELVAETDVKLAGTAGLPAPPDWCVALHPAAPAAPATTTTAAAAARPRHRRVRRVCAVRASSERSISSDGTSALGRPAPG